MVHVAALQELMSGWMHLARNTESGQNVCYLAIGPASVSCGGREYVSFIPGLGLASTQYTPSRGMPHLAISSRH